MPVERDAPGRARSRTARLVGIGALLAGALLVGVLVLRRVGARADGGGPPLDASEVELGRAIYAEHCASCHGVRAEGAPNWRRPLPDGTFPPPPHDSTGHSWHHADGLLYQIVRDGGGAFQGGGFRSAMPAFGARLTPREIRAVIVYLKGLWPPAQRSAQARASAADPFPPEASGR